MESGRGQHGGHGHARAHRAARGPREWETDARDNDERDEGAAGDGGREGRSAVLTATVCVALSGAGLAISLLTAWRRRFRAATRLAAISLLPVGLYLAGLITLARKIGTAVGVWAADLVLKPTVWAGFAVIAVAVVLYLASRIGRDRSGRKAARGGTDDASVAPASSARAIPPAGRTPAVPTASRQPEKSGKAGKGGEFDDIEAILRKHGI